MDESAAACLFADSADIYTECTAGISITPGILLETAPAAPGPPQGRSDMYVTGAYLSPSREQIMDDMRKRRQKPTIKTGLCRLSV